MTKVGAGETALVANAVVDAVPVARVAPSVTPQSSYWRALGRAALTKSSRGFFSCAERVGEKWRSSFRQMRRRHRISGLIHQSLVSPGFLCPVERLVGMLK
jgi:hypothetical protein